MTVLLAAPGAPVNVVNTEQVTKWLNELIKVNDFTDSRLEMFVTRNVRNWMLSAKNPNLRKVNSAKELGLYGIHQVPPWLAKLDTWPDNIYYCPFNPKLRNQLDHAIAFCQSLLTERTANLNNVDVAVAIDKGEALFIKMLNMKVRDKLLSSGGAEAIPVNVEPYMWVNILSVPVMKNEGLLLDNCLAYLQRFETGLGTTVEIWSLRDEDARPHISIEYRKHDKSLYQMEGKGNRANKTYLSQVVDLFRSSWFKSKVTHIGAFIFSSWFEGTPYAKEFEHLVKQD